MKRNYDGILNRDLNELIGKLGHGDLIVVADAGVAVPKGVQCIDLCLTANEPRMQRVLELLKKEAIIERVEMLKDCEDMNPKHAKMVHEVMESQDCEIVLFNDLDEYMRRLTVAKAIIRTGEITPYGTLFLYPGIDPYAYFADPSIIPVPHYRKRLGLDEK